jgi:hypothetical protein
VLALDVNTDVVSVIVTDESDVAETDNDTDSPAPTVPIEPAAVEKLGAVDAVIMLFVDLPALPSGFSILT